MHTDNYIQRISLQFHAFGEVIYWFFMEPVDNCLRAKFFIRFRLQLNSRNFTIAASTERNRMVAASSGNGGSGQ